MSFKRGLAGLGLGAALTIAACGSAQAAAIDVVAYTTGGVTVIDFEDVASTVYPGVTYDGLLTSRGAVFGERFQGQTLSTVTDIYTGAPLDVLSGAPVGPLSLVAGAAGQNLAVGQDGLTANLVPCGAYGCSNPNGYGEGAFAVLFSGPISYFGFQQQFGSGPGLTTLDFFDISGGLIQRVTVNTVGAYAFARAGGVKDIAGVSVFTSDPGGLSYDNLVYDAPAAASGGGTTGGVPEPSAWALMILGFGGAGAMLRRRPRGPGLAAMRTAG